MDRRSFELNYENFVTYSSNGSLAALKSVDASKYKPKPDTLLRVMESDPRVPRFIERDSKTGEIQRIDADMVRADHIAGAGWRDALE